MVRVVYRQISGRKVNVVNTCNQRGSQVPARAQDTNPTSL